LFISSTIYRNLGYYLASANGLDVTFFKHILNNQTTVSTTAAEATTTPAFYSLLQQQQQQQQPPVKDDLYYLSSKLSFIDLDSLIRIAWETRSSSVEYSKHLVSSETLIQKYEALFNMLWRYVH
jgi:hypothetical protein